MENLSAARQLLNCITDGKTHLITTSVNLHLLNPTVLMAPNVMDLGEELCFFALLQTHQNKRKL